MVESVLPLELTDAVVRKRGKVIVGPVDLTVSTEGFTIIMGPNGSGKTTLLRLMHGLEKPSNGSVEWNCDTKIARKRQAFVFQTPVMMRRTALENIIYALKIQGASRENAKSRAETWLKKVGLEEASNLSAGFLSGGEKQKLALARALACEPDVLFLDEPTANLDGRATREIEEILSTAHSQGVRMVMTTHDMGQGKRLAGDVFFLYRGLVHETGRAETFFSNPKTSEARKYMQGDILE
ncbi:MAG: ATP-binding cassette domain-containing protein [Pseudomonadota bacterium]